MAQKRMNINDIAALAGVSKSTVSNYLNGRYESMSEETRSRLAEVIRQNDYTPDLSARRRSTKGKSRTICLIIPHDIGYTFRTQFFPEVMSGLGELAEKASYNLMLFTSSRERLDQQVNYIKGMASSIVDGFLVFDILGNELLIKEFEKAGIPYVCFGRSMDNNTFKYVATDHEGSAYHAARHLLCLGHRRIALLNESEGGNVSRWRDLGIRRAFKEEGVTVNESLIHYVDHEAEDYYKLIYMHSCALLESPEKPTAFIVFGQHLNGFMRAVREKNRRIPQDLSVVVLEYLSAFDDSGWDFTRVPSKAGEVGILAFKKLLRMIYSRDSAFEHETVQGEFISGSTCREIARP